MTRTPRPGRLGWLAVALLACSGQPPERVALLVSARDPLQAPVPGTTFWIDGREVGQSDARGELRLELPRHGSSATTLRHACPGGHHSDEPSRTLPLRGTRAGELRVHVTCRPIALPAPLVVLAVAPEALRLPVLVDGQPTDVTDEHGIAHSLLRLRPGQAVEVSLDTREHPTLRPRNPTRRFVPGATPEILLFEQRFEHEQVRPRRVPGPRARPRRPYHIH